jgi:polar amino acid transport system substrate-binding protein
MLRAVAGLFIGLTLAMTSSAMANERVLVDEANPPFMYSENGKAAGIYSAVMVEAFKRAGVGVDISAAPWKRAIAGIDSAENGVAGIYKNTERLKKYDYSEKLFDEIIIVYAPKGKSFAFSGVDSLKGKTVGVIRGWSYGDDFDAAAKLGAIKTEETASDTQNFAKLEIGRIDAVLSIKESAAGVIAKQKLGDKVVALDPPLSSSASFLAFNKSAAKTALLGKIDEALGAMHKDSSFDKIVSSVLSK